jgi:hypothetical protein
MILPKTFGDISDSEMKKVLRFGGVDTVGSKLSLYGYAKP